MKTLTDVEAEILANNHVYTTFKQCSYDDEHDVYICANETIPVFDLDQVKDAFSKNGNYSAPMSMDTLWIDHEHNTMHLIEFKNILKLEGTKKKDIRLKMLDTLLMLSGELEVNKLTDTKMTLILVRNLGSKDRIRYHVLAKADNYTPAYLEYVSNLTGIKVIELIPEDFEKFIENVTEFNF